MKECPFCGEKIQEKAIKCRFCGERLKNSKTNINEIISKLKKEIKSLGKTNLKIDTITKKLITIDKGLKELIELSSGDNKEVINIKDLISSELKNISINMFEENNYSDSLIMINLSYKTANSKELKSEIKKHITKIKKKNEENTKNKKIKTTKKYITNLVKNGKDKEALFLINEELKNTDITSKEEKMLNNLLINIKNNIKENKFLFILKYFFFFSGEKRVSRTDFQLSFILIIILTPIIILGTVGEFLLLYLIICFIEKIIGRLRDTNWPAWNIIGFFIPILNIILLLNLGIKKGTPGENKYGLNPIGSKIKINKFSSYLLNIIVFLIFTIVLIMRTISLLKDMF